MLDGMSVLDSLLGDQNQTAKCWLKKAHTVAKHTVKAGYNISGVLTLVNSSQIGTSLLVPPKQGEWCTSYSGPPKSEQIFQDIKIQNDPLKGNHYLTVSWSLVCGSQHEGCLLACCFRKNHHRYLRFCVRIKPFQFKVFSLWHVSSPMDIYQVSSYGGSSSQMLSDGIYLPVRG